ncbi:TVP38/TMEM64 family protein [Aerococcaceae bacterium DSM 109653]|uniref:TVP38/TMEM64 family membrane protein n=1 Tax=Fundicoccus ignavus TaxID=2664442 RepID=A0A844BWE2_9LACT|nr:VTT domain-containing protein [Fundicoccus ignavus]MRI82472.1 TVP38/TMEM64 family protein [Fundicoccus ignavus]
MALSLEQKRLVIRSTTIFGVVATILGAYFILQSNYFRPEGGFSDLLINLGIFGPLIFILVQISQIIYPIIPLGLTNVIGDLIFGHAWGFFFNCIGMLIGSSINFFLGRRFGEGFLLAFINDETYQKYKERINRGNGLKKLLIIGFILPLFPDDIFCIIAGMSKITYKEFFKLILFYRPISLFVFTFMSSNIIQFFADLLFGW